MRERHMQLPVPPWHDDTWLRPCGWSRPKRLDEMRQIPLPILTLAQIDMHRIQMHDDGFGREQDGHQREVDRQIVNPHKRRRLRCRILSYGQVMDGDAAPPAASN